jgi:hypothetical protein
MILVKINQLYCFFSFLPAPPLLGLGFAFMGLAPPFGSGMP